MHCIKLLGQRLMTRDFDRQVAEFHVCIAVLNGFTSLGIPSLKPRDRSVREKGNPVHHLIYATEPMVDRSSASPSSYPVLLRSPRKRPPNQGQRPLKASALFQNGAEELARAVLNRGGEQVFRCAFLANASLIEE